MTSAPAFSFRVLTNPGDVQALAPEWRTLSKEVESPTPFLSFDWTWCCWHHRRRRAWSLYVVVCRSAGRLVAVAPLCKETFGGFRVLRYVGEGRSDYLGILAASEEASSALRAHLLQLPSWDVGAFAPSREVSWHHFAPNGRSCARQLTTAAFVQHDGDWASVTKHGPNWLRRVPRKLRKFEGADGTVERHFGRDAAERVEIVGEIERRSWKAANRGGMNFADPRGARFLRETLTSLGETRGMELWLARIGGAPVAFEVNLRSDSWIGLYVGAHDERFRTLGPGSVLEYVSIRQAWSEGVREYDYLTGDEPYKRERTSATRSVYVELLAGPTRRAQLAYPVVKQGYDLYRAWQRRRRVNTDVVEAAGKAGGLDG